MGKAVGESVTGLDIVGEALGSQVLGVELGSEVLGAVVVGNEDVAEGTTVLGDALPES